MIKSIVEKIMVKEFSKYINGIEYNKLTIEVLGGYFSIQNISLNHSFFNSLETPFLVAFSHIGKLSIEVPIMPLRPHSQSYPQYRYPAQSKMST